jgi:hypothetical protein
MKRSKNHTHSVFYEKTAQNCAKNTPFDRIRANGLDSNAGKTLSPFVKGDQGDFNNKKRENPP